MDKGLESKERKLERLTIEEEIADKETNIAEKRALERQAKQLHGRSWRKILGVVKALRPSGEAIQTMYSVSPELRELSRPRVHRRGQ